MINKIFESCFLLLLLSLNYETVNTIDRVVLNSVPIDRGDRRVYLLADKKSWMDYENFTIQVGEQAEGMLYHFPGWYHGKYDTALYYVDVSGDKQKDIVVVLNNNRAELGKPIKDIHILTQKHDLLFEESPIESVRAILDSLTKIDQKGNIVTIVTGKNEHKIDLSKYHFVNPRTPYYNVETVEYSIGNGTLIGMIGTYVVRDDLVQGGLLGHLKVKYGWDGNKYFARFITFKQAEPEQ